jgi:RNA polymerase-binding transcription factor DksA
MTKHVNEGARRRLRARFAEVLELRSREIEDVENAVELWDSGVLSSLSDGDLQTLAEVFAALQRVADGSYGRCVACGQAIPGARLDAVPETTCCVECRASRPSHGWK